MQSMYSTAPADWARSPGISTGTFINDLPIDIKSEIKLCVDDIKLLGGSLSKETTQMNQIKFLYWEDIGN